MLERKRIGKKMELKLAELRSRCSVVRDAITQTHYEPQIPPILFLLEVR